MWYIFDVPPIDGEIISAELQYEITGFTNFQGIELDRSLYTYVESGDSTIFPLPATEESWDYIDDNQAYHDSVLYNGPGIRQHTPQRNGHTSWYSSMFHS